MGTLFTEHPRKVDSLVVAVQHLPGVHHLPYSRKDFDVEDALSSELKSIVQDLDLSAVSTLKHLGLEGSDLRRQSFEVSEKIRRHPLHQINQIELQRNIYRLPKRISPGYSMSSPTFPGPRSCWNRL